MAGMAIAMMILLGFAIYNLSRLSSPPWASQLKPLTLNEQPSQDFPQLKGGHVDPSLSTAALQERWTLINFWSFTCAPCLVELPALNQLALGWQGPEFSIVTVNLDEGDAVEQAKRFLLDNEITLTTVYDTDKSLKAAFNVDAYPYHVLVDPSGHVVWSDLGAVRWNDTAARDQLLKRMELKDTDPVSDPEG